MQESEKPFQTLSDDEFREVQSLLRSAFFRAAEDFKEGRTFGLDRDTRALQQTALATTAQALLAADAEARRRSESQNLFAKGLRL